MGNHDGRVESDLEEPHLDHDRVVTNIDILREPLVAFGRYVEPMRAESDVVRYEGCSANELSVDEN